MDDDDLIAQILGIPREKWACGCLRPFSMGFGYRDPNAMCRACTDRARNRKQLTHLAVVLLVGIVLVAIAIFAPTLAKDMGLY